MLPGIHSRQSLRTMVSCLNAWDFWGQLTGYLLSGLSMRSLSAGSVLQLLLSLA